MPNPKVLIAGGALIAIIALRSRKKIDAITSISQESAPRISQLQQDYSLGENLTRAAELVAMGAGAGAGIGGPIGGVVGAAVGWAAALIAAALRGGVEMGAEIRKMIRNQYKEAGFPNTTQAMEFLTFATYLGATDVPFGVGEDGRVYLAKNAPRGDSARRDNIEGFINTFWSVLLNFERVSPALKRFYNERGYYPGGSAERPYGDSRNQGVLYFRIEMPDGRWKGTKPGQSLADVPWLSTKHPECGVLVQGVRMVYTGLLRENPGAYRVALSWAAKTYGVQNEAWALNAVNAITGSV